MANEGKWADWYQGVEKPWPYGDTTTYEIGAAWLDGCALIEDWGCGAGWLRTLVPPDQYRGIDGTSSPFCDEVVDLVSYRSTVPAIFMRHVLEHNHDWRAAPQVTNRIRRTAPIGRRSDRGRLPESWQPASRWSYLPCLARAWSPSDDTNAMTFHSSSSVRRPFQLGMALPGRPVMSVT
jgi:hypothetical protein